MKSEIKPFSMLHHTKEVKTQIISKGVEKLVEKRWEVADRGRTNPIKGGFIESVIHYLLPSYDR